MPSFSFELHGTVSGLGIVIRFFIDQSTVSQLCIDAVHPVPDVRIKLNAAVFRLGLEGFVYLSHSFPHFCLLIDRVIGGFASESRKFQALFWLYISILLLNLLI